MTSFPKIGGTTLPLFNLQFPDAKIDQTSVSVTLIELLANDGSGAVLSHATGFFWRVGDRLFLVTARHVLTGREPFRDDLTSSQGYIPQSICVYPSIKLPGNQHGRVRVQLSLYRDEEPVWFQDPEFSVLRTDIAAVELPAISADAVQCLDTGDYAVPMLTYIGLECALIGYPTSNVAGAMTPVWRRGTIASEPRLPIDDKPMFLLDAATSPGFSGAPVFRRHIGPLPFQEPDGSISMRMDAVVTRCFVGVYAGRLQHSHYGGEVPFVFYGNRLERILSPEALQARPSTIPTVKWTT